MINIGVLMTVGHLQEKEKGMNVNVCVHPLFTPDIRYDGHAQSDK